MAKGSSLGALKGALGNADFRRYTYGNLFSYIAYWIQRIAVGWLTWELTQSPFWVGLVAFADLAPSFVLAPLAGAVADRIERLGAIRVTQGLAAVHTLVIAALVQTGTITVGLLVLIVFSQGIVMAFNQPLRLAAFPTLVARKDMAAAVSINSLIFNIARIAGPAGAGATIEFVGIAPCFALCTVGYATFVATLWFVGAKSMPHAGAAKPVREIPAEIVEGFRYSVGHPGIGPVMLVMTVVAISGRAFVDLLPAFAGAVFGTGADGLALLTGAMGVGAILGGLFLATRTSVAGLTRMVATAILASAITVLGFALSPDIWVATALMLACGTASVFVGIGEQTLVQNAVEGSMRGRVMSLYGVIARAGPAIGALAMGTAAEFVGLRWPVAVGALALFVLWLWLRPRCDRLAAHLEGEAGGRPTA